METKSLPQSTLGYVEAILSISTNIILAAFKYWVGLQTASIAILADAWHTLSDSFTSIILLVGFKISKKPPDKKHPYGHGRAEIIASVFIGTILAIVGFNFLIESINRFRTHQAANYGLLAIIAISISVLLKELLAQYAFWASKKTNSMLLRADGWHHRSDALSSLVVLVGIFLGKYFWWIDSIVGMIISLMIFYLTFDILKNSVSSLLGEEPDEKMKLEIYNLIRNNLKEEINLHHMHFHSYGEHKELTFHIELPADLRLKDAHTISDNIENLIREKLKIEATIHTEPIKKNR